MRTLLRFPTWICVHSQAASLPFSSSSTLGYHSAVLWCDDDEGLHCDMPVTLWQTQQCWAAVTAFWTVASRCSASPGRHIGMWHHGVARLWRYNIPLCQYHSSWFHKKADLCNHKAPLLSRQYWPITKFWTVTPHDVLWHHNIELQHHSVVLWQDNLPLCCLIFHGYHAYCNMLNSGITMFRWWCDMTNINITVLLLYVTTLCDITELKWGTEIFYCAR